MNELCGGWTFCSCSLLVTFCLLLVTFCSLLVTFCLLLVVRYFLLIAYYFLLVTFWQLSWATVQLLVTPVTLIYLVDEFFMFSFLALLKEMRTSCESMISSCWFSCKSRELGDRGWGGGGGVGGRGPRFPCVNPVVESSWGLLRVIIKYWAESHLKSCQTSTRELSCKNNQQA